MCLAIQMDYSDWLKNDSLCLRLQRSTKFYFAIQCNGLGFDIQRLNQEDRLKP